jgi:hypothetical protein
MGTRACLRCVLTVLLRHRFNQSGLTTNQPSHIPFF